MSRRLSLLLLAAALSAPVAAQQIYTFTEDAGGPNTFVYGLPVPEPIDSLTPVDGFRSYPALEARLQALALASDDLSAHDIGRSAANRVQWAYVASDADGVDVEGRPEAAFFINATTHAREWGAPEVATGTLERLLDGADDGGIVRYLLDNTRVVVIPVHNVDGLLQTQRYPTQAILGADPDFPNDWPRDGRMRRKNMPGVDEVLTTFADHLGGTDLNRNHPPLWATSVGSGGSSANPASLTYHGTAPHGEPENRSLERAAELGPATRMRLGIDVHTFSKVFYSSNTGRTRLNAIQASLIDRLRTHHVQISGGKNYQDVPDPANRGIGAAAEYFAYEWLVPAWTLELEPSNSAAEYGGTNVTHSGFILPASQARRVRESWAETHLVAFYRMAGPAHVARVRFFEVGSGRLAQQLRWVWNAATGQRTLERSGDASLVRGQRYRVELSFNKPMRFRNGDGVIVPIPGAAGVSRAVDVALLDAAGASLATLDTGAGEWLTDAARVLRYRDDTFAFEFDAPASSANFRLAVGTRDFTGVALDADPATPADWADGAWSAYESAVGVSGDSGGVDRSTVGFTAAEAMSPLVTLVSSPAAVGEGDAARIVLRRAGTDLGGTVTAFQTVNGEGVGTVVQWASGEGGDRTLLIPIPDDADVDGDRAFELQLASSIAPDIVGVPPPLSIVSLPPIALEVVDNDSSDLAVLRVRAGGSNMFDVLSLATDVAGGGNGRTGATAVVIDRDVGSDLPARDNDDARPSAWIVGGPLTLHGNQAALAPQQAGVSSRALFEVGTAGTLRIDALDLRVGRPETARPIASNAGHILLQRSILGDGGFVQPPLLNSGELSIERSVLVGVATEHQFVVLNSAGSTSVQASTLAARGDGIGANLAMEDGDLRLVAATVVGNSPAQGLPTHTTQTLGHVLLQDNDFGTIPIPEPPPVSCGDVDARSLGYNVSDEHLCAAVASDRSGTDVELAAFDDALAGFAPTGVAIDTGGTAAEATATGCGPIDQRGAPRPQTLTPGAIPRCDIGAIELGINPYRGIWAPTRSGHGLDLQTSGNVLLLAWYTYADDGQPTAYQAAAPLTGPHWEARLQWSRRDPDTGVAAVVDVGRVTIDFASDTQAQLGWRFDARGVDGTEAIQASLFDTGTPRFEVTGLWFPPEEANYGATITRRGETTAIGLYYYDAGGTIRWALGTGDAADAVDLPMTSFTGFCPDCDATQMPVSGAAAGRLLAHFRTPERARLDVALTYPRGAGGTWNRTGVRFVPLNDAVDNRAAVGGLAK